MPSPRSSPAMSKGTALAVSGALGVAALVLLLIFVVRLLDESGNSTLGDETFDTNASALAVQVARNGPILFPDLLGKGRDIYIQHLSEDRMLGWRAFRATAPDAVRACTLTWDRVDHMFHEPCPPNRTFPADGEGLEQYQAGVTGSNKLVVDLRRTIP